MTVIDGVASIAVVPPWVFAVLSAPFVGSFLGVLVARLPDGRPVALARSACDTCSGILRPFELVPLLSYIVQRGRCRRCSAPIGRHHLFMELAAVIVPLSTAFAGAPGLMWVSCLLGWSLLTLTVIDWQRMILPDVLTLPLLVSGLCVTWWIWPPDLADHAAAAAFSYAAFRAISALYFLVRKRPGLGAGDAKLMAACGAWVGLSALPAVVLIASSAGLALAIVSGLRSGRVSAQMAIPFGPFLAVATWTVWLFN